MDKIAVLLTCYNRRNKTISCLKSFYKAVDLLNGAKEFDVFLVDDGCTDGTPDEVKVLFPQVNIIAGTGNLFWSGGMRFAWETALSQEKKYDFFLLLNDDVELMETFLNDLFLTHDYCFREYNKSGIYVSSTKDKLSSKISYGGTLITHRGVRVKSVLIEPTDVPVRCTMANANILMVTKSVVDKIGILDKNYVHQFGDYDYTLVASKNEIPVLVCPGFGGYCSDDHGNSWLASDAPLKQRIKYLYSTLGLSYKEQIYYLKKNFRYQFPYYFTMLWLKTLFPVFWTKYKKA